MARPEIRAAADAAEPDVRERRTPTRHRLAVGVAVLTVLWAPSDLILDGDTSWRGLVVRVALAALVLGLGVQWPLRARWARRLHAFALPVAWTASLSVGFLVTGGPGGYMAGWVLAHPVIVALLLPERPLGVAVAGGMLAGAVLAAPADPQALSQAMVLASLAFTTGLGLYHSWSHGRRLARRARVESRIGALEDELAAVRRRRDRAEKLAVLGRLAAGIPDDLGTPLERVRSDLKYVGGVALSRTGPEASQVRVALREALGALDHIEDRLAQIVLLGLDEPGEVETCRLSGVIEEARSLCEPGVLCEGVEVSLPPEVPCVAATRPSLVQVLVNLLENAADAVSECESPRIRISAERQGDQVLVRVDDNGPGVPPSMRATIFEMFFSTKAGESSAGLGLAFAREHLQEMGADVHVDESPLGGARFTLVLRSAEAESRRAVA